MKSVSTEGYERYKQPDMMEEKNAILIGRSGVGKSGIFGNLIGLLDFQSFGWDAGTTSTVKGSIRNENCFIKLIDTIGWSGLESDDLRLFQELRNVLMDEAAKIHRIFFVVNAKRFTEVDQKIINFLRHHASDEMKSIIHVIVTHAPKFEQDETLKAHLKRRFDFLFKPIAPHGERSGDTPIEAPVPESTHNLTIREREEAERRLFESKVTFVDLIDPRRFIDHPQTRDVILEEWETFRNRIIAVIQGSHDHVLVRRFKSSWVVVDFIRLYWNEIVMTIMIGLIFALVLVLSRYYQISISLREENQVLGVKFNTTINKLSELNESMNKAKPILTFYGWVEGSIKHVFTTLWEGAKMSDLF